MLSYPPSCTSKCSAAAACRRRSCVFPCSLPVLQRARGADCAGPGANIQAACVAQYSFRHGSHVHTLGPPGQGKNLSEDRGGNHPLPGLSNVCVLHQSGATAFSLYIKTQSAVPGGALCSLTHVSTSCSVLAEQRPFPALMPPARHKPQHRLLSICTHRHTTAGAGCCSRGTGCAQDHSARAIHNAQRLRGGLWRQVCWVSAGFAWGKSHSWGMEDTWLTILRAS